MSQTNVFLVRERSEGRECAGISRENDMEDVKKAMRFTKGALAGEQKTQGDVNEILIKESQSLI